MTGLRDALREGAIGDERPGGVLAIAGGGALVGGLVFSVRGFPAATLLALLGYGAVMMWVGKRVAFPPKVRSQRVVIVDKRVVEGRVLLTGFRGARKP